MLINNMNAAICLLDTPFAGCHNSKIVSLSISTPPKWQERLHQVSLSVVFHLFCFFLLTTLCILWRSVPIISGFSPRKLSWQVFHIVLIIQNTRIMLAQMEFSL